MATIITLEGALAALEQAVENHGADYVYRRAGDNSPCLNVHVDSDGNLTPGCIVGHALLIMGVPLEAQLSANGTDAYVHIANLARQDVVRFEQPCSTYDQPAVIALRAAQSAQDSGRTWGEALDAARFEAIG